MKVIIEGIDGVGKTTFANSFNTDVIHSTGETINTFNWYKSLLKEKTNIVFDRFAYGEIVYSKLYNRKAKINIKNIEKLEQQIKKQNGIVIFYQATKKVLKKTFEMRNQKFEWKMLKKANRLFKKLLINRKPLCDVIFIKRQW